MDVDKSVQVVIFIVADLSHAKIVVAIINDFGSTVQFHCKSKDIDLGNQRLQPGGSWSFHFQRNFFGSIDAANKAREVSLTSLPLAAGVVAKLGFANHVVEQGEAWKKAKEIAENIMKNEQGFSDLEDVWDDLPVSRLKYNALDDFQEVFQTTFKSSGLPGSRLTKSSPMSLPFITDLSVLVIFQTKSGSRLDVLEAF
uniref:Uncharacterized protein n=1 Tax=Brassica oleracea TaxID=3712 RepID=A0A3P6GMK1_BRAOL|nr:unnamed protein product [Brassica oleracea]